MNMFKPPTLMILDAYSGWVPVNFLQPAWGGKSAHVSRDETKKDETNRAK
jgi:hypothetical protein